MNDKEFTKGKKNDLISIYINRELNLDEKIDNFDEIINKFMEYREIIIKKRLKDNNNYNNSNNNTLLEFNI